MLGLVVLIVAVLLLLWMVQLLLKSSKGFNKSAQPNMETGKGSRASLKDGFVQILDKVDDFMEEVVDNDFFRDDEQSFFEEEDDEFFNEELDLYFFDNNGK